MVFTAELISLSTGRFGSSVIIAAAYFFNYTPAKPYAHFQSKEKRLDRIIQPEIADIFQ